MRGKRLAGANRAHAPLVRPPRRGMKKIAVMLPDPVVRTLLGRVEKCHLCRWILVDAQEHGALTGYPPAEEGKPLFPVCAKVSHLKLEGILAAEWTPVIGTAPRCGAEWKEAAAVCPLCRDCELPESHEAAGDPHRTLCGIAFYEHEAEAAHKIVREGR